MAATQTVAQPFLLRKSSIETTGLRPRQGVITLTGYGIDVRVNSGHLIIEDGIGTDRKRARLPRINHGLKRLVVIGTDGSVSLAALRWLTDQNVSFHLIDRDGRVLMSSAPRSTSDVKLRRAQALAFSSGLDLAISRELILWKLAGQENIALEHLGDLASAATIRQCCDLASKATTIEELMLRNFRVLPLIGMPGSGSKCSFRALI